MSMPSLRKRYERWFKDGSFWRPWWLARFLWSKTNFIGVESHAADRQGRTRSPRDGTHPPDWSGAMWYGVATMVVFTLFYVMAARTWSHYTTDDLTTNE